MIPTLIDSPILSKGRTVLEHALRCVLNQPAVVSAIVGAKRIEQLATMMLAIEREPDTCGY